MLEEYISRRAFLKTAALGAAFAALPHARVMGANDDIRIAIVGVGNKGSQHVGMFKKQPGVRVVALCDADSAMVEAAMAKHFKGEGQKPKAYTDLRKVLEDKDVDAICVATPNHWHALAAVWACQAGKDVYVEKPCSHSLWEGQQLIAAAEKYNRIVQIGTQSRSDSGLQNAMQYINEGNIGKLEYIHGIYYNLRQPIGKVSGPQQPPATVDYDLWCGPAEAGPIMRERFHYDWHWKWKYGNGELGNNGVHMLDLATWILGIKEFPERVISLGGRFLFDDDAETPNTQIAYYDYKPVPIMMELRNLPRSKGEKDADNMKGHRVGIKVKGSDGYYIGYNTGGWVYDNDGKKVKQIPGDGGGAHHKNFLDAMRSRNPDMLAVGVRPGHLSTGLCHLGNISHRLAETAKGDDIQAAAAGHPLLEQTVYDFNEHLLVNGADVKKTPRHLSPWMNFDPSSQRFTGELADEANAMLKDKYRPGFEFPEQV